MIRALLLVLSLAAWCEGRDLPRVPTTSNLVVDADYAGSIQTWVLHFDPTFQDVSVDLYRTIVHEASPYARFVVAVPTEDGIEEFFAAIGGCDAPNRFRFVTVGPHMTCWARDRYVLFDRDGQRHLVIPTALGAKLDRVADFDVARQLARIDPRLVVHESPLEIEGGNVLVDRDQILVGANLIDDNLTRFATPSHVKRRLSDTFGRAVVEIGDNHHDPIHDHLDMFITLVGPKQVLLGDPRLSFDFFEWRDRLGIDHEDVRGLGDFSRESQEQRLSAYQAVAEQLRENGYTVTRIPILHSYNDELVLTWNNAVLEELSDERVAYVPQYGIPLLDERAYAVWRRAGFRVVPVPAESAIVVGGAVRCVTNVLYRAQRSGPAVAVPNPTPHDSELTPDSGFGPDGTLPPNRTQPELARPEVAPPKVADPKVGEPAGSVPKVDPRPADPARGSSPGTRPGAGPRDTGDTRRTRDSSARNDAPRERRNSWGVPSRIGVLGR